MAVQLDHERAMKWLVYDLFPVMLDCQQQVSNLEFLERKSLSIGQGTWIHSFFNQLHHQYYFILVTQMAKVLDNAGTNQRISLPTLLTKLGSSQTDSTSFDGFFAKHAKSRLGMFRLPPTSHRWSSFVEVQADMKSVRDRFKEHRDTIKRIIDQRNTMMAHTDPDRPDFAYIPLSDLRSVFEVAMDIWSTLANNLHPRLTFDFTPANCWQLQNLILNMESLEEHRNFVRQQLFKSAALRS